MSDQTVRHSEPPGGWRQQMPFEVAGRQRKADKIIAIVERERSLPGADVLDIGTGTGVIPAALARAVAPRGSVVSIDAMDTRIESGSYEFRLTSGARLPFAVESFDVVVSNHVIEHLGTRADQQLHLAEIRRVLRPNGVAYIATPTRWALVEPHFRVPFLSWLPRGRRDAYLRLTRRGLNYDVDPFAADELRRAFDRAGLEWTDRTMDAFAEVVRTENRSRFLRALGSAPPLVKSLIRPAMPTMVYVARRRA